MDILDKFIENAKKSLEDGYYKVEGEFPSTKLSLVKTLSQGFTVISEIKHASPAGKYSFGSIDVRQTAQVFKQSGSDAISCVVEPKIFKGNLMNIPLAKEADLPVLLKDFIFHEEQMKAAKTLGADAILLIVKVANRLGLDVNSLVESAHNHGLEVLLESYDVDELNTALSTEAGILGINNRDLQTLKVNIKRTQEILSQVETDRPLISESGITTARDVEFVRNAGARGVLVGTAIWTAEDIGAKIRELKGEAIRELESGAKVELKGGTQDE